MRHKINIVFEQLSLQKFAIKSIIRTCINAVLDAEGINVPCEINVLVTDDAGIQVVNRDIVKALNLRSVQINGQ